MKINKTLLIPVGFLLSIFFITSSVLIVYSPAWPVNPKKFKAQADNIKPGMTKEEVLETVTRFTKMGESPTRSD